MQYFLFAKTLLRNTARFQWHGLVRLSMLAACLCLTDCGIKRVDDRGYRDADLSIGSIKEGASTREDVMAALGSPSTQSDFGPETWYYVSTVKESEAFFKPTITQQKVLRVQFSDAGVVQKIENYDLSQSKNIQIVDKVTPTEGHKLGVIEQIVGNLGRFNKPSDSTGPTTPHKTH
jgi:outer membrane protein assembly factor BamE (lipoprotein component of BamABCDE complex)